MPSRRRPSPVALLVTLAGAALLAPPASAEESRAEAEADEVAVQLSLRHALRFEASGSAAFGVGPAAALLGLGFGVAYEFRALPALGVLARYSATFFPGEQPLEADGGAYHGFGGGLRLHPAPRLVRGDLWITASGALALIGGERRGALEVALGFDFQVARYIRVGPSVGYLQVLPASGGALADGFGLVQLGVGLVGLIGGERRPPPDRDGDKLPDPDDACPDEPEDEDRFRDDDGCPDPDNDLDGIPDVDDECPRYPEDRDGDRDEDGCAEDPLDRDGDSVVDPEDLCPEVPEDLDLFEDEDGCPDLDDDLDGIPDVDDRCPNDPEVVNGYVDADGCPDEVPAELVELRELAARVLFDNDEEEPTAGSLGAVGEVARLLGEHPEWQVLLIAGHASDTGESGHNQALSLRRAERVRVLLVRRHGVSPRRLRVRGFGEEAPEVPGETEEARARNRRVVFTVERAASGE